MASCWGLVVASVVAEHHSSGGMLGRSSSQTLRELERRFYVTVSHIFVGANRPQYRQQSNHRLSENR